MDDSVTGRSLADEPAHGGELMKNDIRDLALVLESRLRLVVIESWDERRVLETLTGLAVTRAAGLYLWSVTEGLRRFAFGG